MEIIFADGAFLDTSSLASRRDFMQTHIGLLEKLMNFRLEILLNQTWKTGFYLNMS